MPGRASRHRGQAGTTLVELVVSVMIIALALLLLVGAFSTGLLDATLVKRNTGADAAIEFELERIQSAAFSTAPQPYSECFAIDNSASPSPVAFRATCPSGTSLRLDVTETDVQTGTVQQWNVQVVAYPAQSPVGAPVSVYKINR
jgi:type II secretory pathway pseudopilin PulG